MRVELYHFEAVREEIEFILGDEGGSIRRNTIRFVRADTPIQPQEPYLTFKTALLISFVDETILDSPQLIEGIVKYGDTPQPSSEKYGDPDQPHNKREAELIEFQAWCKERNLALRPGRIDF